MNIILLAVLEYAILASTFTISKVAVGFADPIFLIGVRMVASSPLMFLVHLWKGEGSFAIKKKDYPLFLKAGLFHIFLPFICEFWALQFVSSAKTAITYSLTPFIAALLSYFLLQEKLTIKQAVGLVVGLLGILPILISRDEVEYISGELFFVSVPEVVLLAAVVSASYAWFLVSELMKRGYGISLINGISMFLGGMLSLILWFIVAQHESPIKGSLTDFFLWTSILIVVANVISYNFYGWLLRHISINFMSALGFLCPIFASLYGFVLLNEDLGLSHVIALVVVCVGLALFYSDEIKKDPLKVEKAS